jgi:ABC-type uncharacterized transport system substrate-binding protein
MTTTGSIPIVFTSVGDPVGAGLVKSLREPGGNVTGMSALAADIAAKKLQLLDDLVPGRKLVAVLGNPDTPLHRARAEAGQNSSLDYGDAVYRLRCKNGGRSAEGN